MPQFDFLADRPTPAQCGPAPHVDVRTSIDAAAEIEPHAGLMREKVLEFIRARGELGATDEEVRFALGLKADTARARRCELRDAGLVAESRKRRPTACGRLSIVWVAGREGSGFSQKGVQGWQEGARGQGLGAREEGRRGDAERGDSQVSASPRLGVSASTPSAGDPCPKCGATEFRDVPVHQGESVRRDCVKCRAFIRFTVWYGRAL